MKITINRFFENETTTIGCMTIEGIDTMLFTCENAWKDNQQSISCIPTGEYKVIRHISPSKGECFKLLNVENREHILFHSGNTHNDTRGCILIGTKRGVLNKNEAVLESKKAMNFLLKILDNEFDLEIISSIENKEKMCYFNNHKQI